MKTQPLSVLQERIGEYKRKFYLNQLVKGVIFAAAFVLSAYLFVNTIEYFGRFSSAVRGTLFFGFLAILGYALARWVVTPLVHLYGLRKSLSDEEAAGQIGNFFLKSAINSSIPYSYVIYQEHKPTWLKPVFNKNRNNY